MLMLLLTSLISLMIGGVIFLFFSLISMKNLKSLEKLSTFECGFTSKKKNNSPFSLSFFLITLIFLVFDVELVLLFPYLFCLNSSSITPILIYMSVILFLSLGFIWEWKQMSLSWSQF